MTSDNLGTGEDLWGSLAEDENAHQFDRFFPYPFHVLFQDAVRAFDAEAYTGTSLLCRAVLEGVFYSFLTRSVARDTGTVTYHLPTDMTGKLRRVSFDEILRAMRKSSRKYGVFSDELLDAARRIQERGNVLAHIGTHEDKTVWYRDVTMKRPPLHRSLAVGKEEAWKDLWDTAAILKRLARLVEHYPEATGPGPWLWVKRSSWHVDRLGTEEE